jgi:adenylosuccinate synthase
MPAKVCAVVGAQFGSEGKGVVVKAIANEYNCHVRTGGPNAGHSMVYKGEIFKHQVLPCGWVNPDATLILGRGILLDVQQLDAEVKQVSKHFPDIRSRIVIDSLAGVLSPQHKKREGGVEGDLHKKIGSTGKGVGAARIARINRDPADFQLAHQHKGLMARYRVLPDTPSALADFAHEGGVLLEGTQGQGLDMVHGPWPYVTSAGTGAAQLLCDTGLAPQLLSDVILVARSYPIRVAGNSGPLFQETDWKSMSDRVGFEVEERTTVTKKTRRIGHWDEGLVRRAVTLNGAKSLAFTFLDYLFPEDAGKTTWDDLSEDAQTWIYYLERTFGVKVTMIGTGFSEESGWIHIDLR